MVSNFQSIWRTKSLSCSTDAAKKKLPTSML